MTTSDVPAGWADRYLALIGAEQEAPSVAALERLVGAHGRRSVFENVTAILRRARVGLGGGPVPAVDYDELLRLREAGRGGGVCFELAPMFRRLLSELGYRVTPILGQISFPGSHHATIVDFPSAERYLVDAGSGAPLWRPIRLGETVEFRHPAGLGYRFTPEGEETYVQERWSEDGWQVACRYDLRAAIPETIESAYQRHQMAGETWVVGNITLVRCTEEAVHRLRDDELVTHAAGGKRVARLGSTSEYEAAAREVFGLPALPIGAALEVLDEIRRLRRASE
ncbi:MAG TPA: arylamine N-acetyltransferase [Chloroflexota bacterium]|nr:arylamine N-acetyltransferase [Chloroflexota bacterium]